MNILKKKTLSRRTFLRGAGVTLALPWLECMSPLSRSLAAAGGLGSGVQPKRAVFCMWGMGVNGREFTPKTFGHQWEVTPILKPLAHLRDDFTLISGLKLTHSGGHAGDRTFLTGTNTHDAGAKLRISCDQELAAVMGGDTRFSSLTLGINRGTGFGSGTIDNTLAWSASGTPIPAENRPHVLFERLFRTQSPEEIAQERAQAAKTSSVLDVVREQAQSLHGYLGKTDQEKLDEYFTSIRKVESQMENDLAWIDRPRPAVESPNFDAVQSLDPQSARKEDFDYEPYARLMFDVITLALQTDSTRVISYMARKDLSDGTHTFRSRSTPYGYHEMTHHGEDPSKLKWLTQVDTWYSEQWAYFVEKLKGIQEGDSTLLDNTLLVWGSTGGTLNAHNNTNLPTMLFGGKALGVRHAGHILHQDMRLGNLWQSMFGVLGVPVSEDFQGGEADGVIPEIMPA